MTLEEIEARWKAATPGPWKASTDPIPRIDDAQNNPVYWCDSYESYPICSDDLRAIAAAPTDIAYLLDRVRELAGDNRSLRDRLRDEFSAHNESIVRVLDDLAKYKRAHAWFVDRCDLTDEAGCSVCGGDTGHKDGCEWVKAKELRI